MPAARPIALTVTLSLAAGAAFAVGSETATPPPQTQTSQDCTDGQVWDAEKGACVEATSGSLTDDQRYEAARELAHAGRYADALVVLSAAEAPNDPRFLNYTGFLHRKAGRFEVAMGYYRRALAIDPDYHMARSYMGKGLVAMGDIEGAKAQLAEIRARGGRDTWAYVNLKRALQGNGGY